MNKTRTHSFAPVARQHGKNTLVAWLEAAAETGAEEPAHVSLVELDDTGHPVGAVQSVQLASGSPLTLGLDCEDSACHVVVTADDNSHSVLYALTFKDGKASTAVRLRSVNRAPSGVAPIIHGREVYLADTQQGRSHVRRLLLDW